MDKMTITGIDGKDLYLVEGEDVLDLNHEFVPVKVADKIFCSICGKESHQSNKEIQ